MPIRHLALYRILRDESLPVSLFEPYAFRDALVDALDPVHTATLYRRSWRISRPQIEGDRWLWAKLGFERPSALDRSYYDEVAKDFVTSASLDEIAIFSYFLIDLESQFIIFELRPPDIRMQTFVRAFQALLDSNVGNRLVMESVPDIAEFLQWLDTVDSVTRVRISLRRPNPNFDGRPESIRNLLEATNASHIDLEARATPDQPLKVIGTDLEAYAKYAADAYGTINAQGFDGSKPRRFTSSRNVVQEGVELEPGEAEESIVRKLITALQNRRR